MTDDRRRTRDRVSGTHTPNKLGLAPAAEVIETAALPLDDHGGPTGVPADPPSAVLPEASAAVAATTLGLALVAQFTA